MQEVIAWYAQVSSPESALVDWQASVGEIDAHDFGGSESNEFLELQFIAAQMSASPLLVHAERLTLVATSRTECST